VARGDFEVVSSELTLLETLIGPLKQGDVALEMDYENIFITPGVRLLPITSPILRAAARHRASLRASGHLMPFTPLPAAPAVVPSSSRMT
jgi:predicted nucleic acid-binding protein